MTMPSSGLHALTLAAAAEAIAEGTLTARALADAQLARIDATDAEIQAWAHLDPDRVRIEADRCDRTPRSGRGSLHGIGIGVKDIIATADQPTQMGSPIYAAHQPREDAECVARLARAGGYVFGKAETTAFAFLDPARTRNPWNPRHTPGGSSAGPAAAVAAGHVCGAIGTQTNGSVIRPAAFCGVVGFKPSKDVIPFGGIHPFSETLDQAGTFTRNVADAARLASALSNVDAIGTVPRKLEREPRIAWLARYPWTASSDAEADAMLEAAATKLKAQGATVVVVDFPAAWREAHLVHRTIMLFEAAGRLGELQSRERERLSPKLNAALDAGRSIAKSDYAGALLERDAAKLFFTEWLSTYDAIVSPPAPGTAPEGLESTGDPSCCTLWSLTGFPAITLPIGVARNGLPLGMQLATVGGADDRLLSVAAWCEARLRFAGLV